MVAVAALARRGTGADVDRLLDHEPDAEGGGLFCVLVDELPRRKDDVLTARRLATLTEALVALLEHGDPSVRHRALQAVKYGRVFHTSRMVETLESIRSRDLHPESRLIAVLARIDKTLNER
jgi:hypothetical protein